MATAAQVRHTLKGSPMRKRLLTTLGLGLVLTAIVVVLMLFLTGTFHKKVAAANEAFTPGRPAGNATLVTVQSVTIDAVEPAVGTIRPVYESAVASKIMERVVEMNVKAGQHVKQGQVLAKLDNSSLKNRLEQASSSLAAAQANADQTLDTLTRTKRARQSNVATDMELKAAENANKASQADLARAKQSVQEATIALAYATILSPMDGTVVDKKVDVGDTVSPGQVMLTLFDPGRMQLVATVRESLAQQLAVGKPINVHIDAINASCTGTISEIVPEAQSASRSFSVKVTGPCRPGVYTGMFGRLMIPLGQQKLLVIPQAAVRRVGQLDLVDVAVKQDGKTFLERRAVQLGERMNDQVCVLSGLQEGERVALPTP